MRLSVSLAEEDCVSPPATTDSILALCSTARSTFCFLLLQNQDSLLQPGYVMPFSFPPSTRWSVHITSPDSGAYLLPFSIPLQFGKFLPTSQDHLPSFLFPPPSYSQLLSSPLILLLLSFPICGMRKLILGVFYGKFWL